MWEDPIVKETRGAREELLERYGFDLEALCSYLRELEAQSDKKAVILAPRPAVKTARKAS
jgi:DNA polymerase III delta subunit